MTPQEKAKELVEKFYAVHPWVKVGTREQIDNKTLEKRYGQAKQCALIAVDEIIKSYAANISEMHVDVIDKNPCEYWEQVKEELEKLK